MNNLEAIIKEYGAMWSGTGVFFGDAAVRSYAKLLSKYEIKIVQKALKRAINTNPEKPMSAPALRHVCEDIKKGQEIARALPAPGQSTAEPEPPPLPEGNPFAKLEAEWRKNPPKMEDNPARRIVEMLSAKAKF